MGLLHEQERLVIRKSLNGKKMNRKIVRTAEKIADQSLLQCDEQLSLYLI